MNDNGWIKIRKSIYNHWLWQDAEYLKWWIDLLLMANWEDDKKLVGKQLIDVKRGQLIASVSFLVKRWKRNHKMIERFLSLLLAENMISKCVKSNISIITITNYDKHQSNENKEIVNANGVNSGVNLKTNVTSYKSELNDTHEHTQGVSIGVNHGVSIGVNPGVTIKEYKESKEDNRLLNSNLCYNSNELQPLESVHACEKVETLESEAITDRFPWNKLQALWNTTCVSFPRLISISDKRKNKVRVRVKEMGCQDKAFEFFEVIFSKMETSNFLRGDNKRGWKASFDWLVENSNNWVKVYEGTYDNNIQQQNQTQPISYGNNNAQPGIEQRAASALALIQRKRAKGNHET